MADYDVLVVGAGIIGTAVFEALSIVGMNCLLVESRRVGFGATGYSGAMVRLSHPDAASVAAAGLGLQRYGQFEAESGGRTRLSRCGHLYFGAADELDDILTQVQAISPSARVLYRDEIPHQFPGMTVTAEAALYEPDAGFGNPIAFAKHQCAKGILHGGTLAEATSFHHLILNDGAITGAQTSQGTIGCRHVVLALGVHTSQVLANHNLEGPNLWEQKIQVSQFQLPQPAQDWPGFVDDHLGLNGLPGFGHGRYYVGLPTGERVAPEGWQTHGTLQHSTRTRDVAQGRLPSLSGGRVQGAMCHPDCYSDSQICEIGPLKDGPDGLCLATGFSGGGFKMAPYAAQRVSEILI